MSAEIKKLDEIQLTLNSKRPKVLLTGENRLLSELARDLGVHLASSLYLRSGEVVRLDGAGVKPVTPQAFRSFVEQIVIPVRPKSMSDGTIRFNASMFESEARGVLASVQFTEQLREVERINSVRLPVLRDDGRIELLPEGYDDCTRTFTLGGFSYRADMKLKEARTIIDDLFGEFEFADDGRSMAVSVAALVGGCALGILPPRSIRPAFIITKNAEGAGASTLASCIAWPFIGGAPFTTMPSEDDEMRKMLTTFVRDGKQYLIFDNVKGKIGGPSIESFISSSLHTGRLLGTNQTVTLPNYVTVIFTANGATVSPDIRRRSLFIELHLSVEKAEDRIFRRPLTASALAMFRQPLLAATWALIRSWDEAGRPGPSRSHSAFPEWAQIVGGIVEFAGYACPFQTPHVSQALDEDGDAVRSLAHAMQPGKRYTSREIAELCRSIEALPAIVSISEEEMDRSQRSAFGKVLARFNNRMLGDRTFFIDGSGHNRRFFVAAANGKTHGHTVEHGSSPPENIRIPIKSRGNTMQTMLTMQPLIPSTPPADSGTAEPLPADGYEVGTL